jgi:hypothetical protein
MEWNQNKNHKKASRTAISDVKTSRIISGKDTLYQTITIAKIVLERIHFRTLNLNNNATIN